MLKPKRLILWILIGVVVAAAGYFLFPRALLGLRTIELSLVDLRFRLRQAQPTGTEIVIVDIDTSSLSKLETWPWPRSYYAKALQVLNKHGAKVVGFDILFDSKSSIGPNEDAMFAKALQKYPNAVLASRRYGGGEQQFALSGWSLPIKSLRLYADYGFVNEYLDIDSRVRKSWLFMESPDQPLRFSWDVAIVAQYRDMVKGKVRESIPYFEPGLFHVNYAGPEGTFTHIPFFLVLEDRYKDMSIFKNKIVLIGATDPILHDQYETPFGFMSGVEIHANALHTILSQRFITITHPLIDLVIVFGMTILIVLASLRLRAILGLIIAAVLLSGYSAVAILSFIKWDYMVAWGAPLIFGSASYFVVVVVKFIREEKEKRRIKGMFQQYVAPSVVDELLKDPSKLKLGGEKRTMTVFFSDIRSFTTYSEKHTPEQVVDVLNEYLDAMTLCIFKWKGTLDKYVGDEIMATWGAPIYTDKHAELALGCCWDQLHVLRDLQHKWRAEGKDILDIGMGLNTGEMIVGNIGSTVHKDYTVIGDAVNLAARLESETRHHGTPEKPCYLIISEFTYECVKDMCTVKSLGEVVVKGKTVPIKIYEVTDVH